MSPHKQKTCFLLEYIILKGEMKSHLPSILGRLLQIMVNFLKISVAAAISFHRVPTQKKLTYEGFDINGSLFHLDIFDILKEFHQ